MFLLLPALVKPIEISLNSYFPLFEYIYFHIIHISLHFIFCPSSSYCPYFSLILLFLSVILLFPVSYSVCSVLFFSYPVSLFSHSVSHFHLSCVSIFLSLSLFLSISHILTQSSSHFSTGIEGLKKKDLARDWMGLSFEISPSQTKSNFL